MKRSLIIILFLLLNLANVCAQSTFTARVVDATTGDPLPMASVYVSSSHSIITNQEGDFSIVAQPEDVLRITYVGYNAKNVMASELGRKVALKPFYKFRNYYTTSCIAPMLPDPGIWRDLYTPLPYKWTKHYYDDLYNLSYAILQGDDDSKIIVVQFGETAQGTTHAMTGRLMFDMDKLRLLSFRGKVHNELVRIRYRTSGPTSMFRYCPRDIEIQMTYKHDRGFDEVASIGTRMVVNRGKNDYGGVYWSTLFNIGNYDIGEGTSTRKEDIYNALSQRGNDEAFREHYKIVKTTSTEEAIIRKFEREGCFGTFTK